MLRILRTPLPILHNTCGVSYRRNLPKLICQISERNYFSNARIHRSASIASCFFQVENTTPSRQKYWSPVVISKKNFTSERPLSASDGSGSDDDDKKGDYQDEKPHTHHSLPATVVVPEVWPYVPVIAINRNPVFPRFIKLVEITNPVLIDLIRRKVRLNQPYAGIFLKKSEENDKEIVNSLDEIYLVGTFAQIHEMQDLGDKLRLVVMAHRRIKILQQLPDDIESEDSNGRKKKRKKKFESTAEPAKENAPVAEKESAEPKKYNVSGQPVLMAEVENITHEKFRQTEEVKVYCKGEGHSDQVEDNLLKVPKPDVSIFSKKLSKAEGSEGENLTLTPNVEIFLRNANNSSDNLIHKLAKINLFKAKQLKKLKKPILLKPEVIAGTSKCDKEPGAVKNGMGTDSKAFHLTNLPCPHCRQVYNNLSALKYHVRLMHSDLENKLFCHLCPMNFIEREYFKIHLWEAHNARF